MMDSFKTLNTPTALQDSGEGYHVSWYFEHGVDNATRFEIN